MGGSELVNVFGEQWPRTQDMFESEDDEFFLTLRLADDGSSPFDPADPAYTTTEVGDLVRLETVEDVFLFIDHTVDVYQSTIEKLEAAGYRDGESLFIFPYDW